MKKVYAKTVSVWCSKRQRYVTESVEEVDYQGDIAECKSFFKGKKAPPPPPPPAPKIVQDLINGVETVTETRDGQEYVITRQLPLSAEQQAIKDRISASLDRIDALSSGLAVLNPEYAPMVEQLRAWQQQTRGQMFGEAARAQGDELARRGLGNSTAAAQARSNLNLQLGQQTQADEVNLFGLAEQQRTAELGRLGGALELRTNLNQQNLNNLTNAGINTANTQSNRLTLDNQIQQTNYQNQLTAFQNQRPSAFSSLLSTGAGLGMAYLSGGGSLAGLFGSKAATDGVEAAFRSQLGRQ